jgi:hypothetical protein
MAYRIWLSYDLGIDGSYQTLYEVLDEYQARECGDSVATLLLPAAGNLVGFERELKKRIKPRKTDRLYVIYLKENGQPTGRFVHGSRRRAPWTGYASAGAEDSSDE